MSANSSVSKRVLFVATELGVGGAEKCVTNLALGFAKRGYQVQVASLLKRPPPPKDILVQRLEAAGIQLAFFDGSRQWQLPIVRRKLQSLVKQFAPNAISSFLFHANVLVGSLAPKLSRGSIRHVASIRVAEARRSRLLIERMMLRKAAQIVCVSNGVRDFCLNAQRLPSDKLIVIPNAIETPGSTSSSELELIRSELSLLPTDRIALFVGRLARQKNVLGLLNLWKRILENKTATAAGSSWKLLLVGEGEDKPAVEQFIVDHGLQNSVRLCGWRGNLAPFYSLSHVVLLASIYEGMPNALLEASAFARPWVAFDVEGVRELAGDSYASQVAPLHDEAQFSMLASNLLNDSAFAGQIGVGNQSHVFREFSIEKMLDRFEASLFPKP